MMDNREDVITLINQIGSGDHSQAVVNFDQLVTDRVNSKLNARTLELAQQLFGPSIATEGKDWTPKEEKKPGEKNGPPKSDPEKFKKGK